MTRRCVYVLEHFTRSAWRPLVSGVRKKRVEEHRDELVADGEIAAEDLRVVVYGPLSEPRGVDR